MTDQANKQAQDDEVIELTNVDQFARVFHAWHSRMLDRLRNLRDIPFGTEVTITDNDGKETKVKLKGDGMQGFQAALNAAISELADTPFVASLEDKEATADGNDAPEPSSN